MKCFWKASPAGMVLVCVVSLSGVQMKDHPASRRVAHAAEVFLAEEVPGKTIPAGTRLSPEARRILDQIREIERDRIRYDEESPNWLGYEPGRIPVLISAPHGAKHYRKNRWKGEDEYTAAIAVVLGRMTGAHVLFVRNKIHEDPNFDLKCRFKDRLQEIVRKNGIRFVLDLHGANRNRAFKVDVGIRNEADGPCTTPTFKRSILQGLSGFQEKPFNQEFCARGKGRVTCFVRDVLGIEAAQVEINARYRVLERKPDSCKARAGKDPGFKADEKDVYELVKRLAGIIRDIERQIEKGKA